MKQFSDSITFDGGGYSFGSEEISLQYLYGFAVHCSWTDSTPDPVAVDSTTDVNVPLSTFTSTAHGMKTGLKVVLTTDDTAPSGVVAGQTYYIIKTDDDNFQVASSSANAQAGTALPLYSEGVGTQTFTPDALAGASIKLQANVGDDSWSDVPDSTVSITGDSEVTFNVREVFYKSMRVYVTLTAGQLDVEAHINSKGW